MKNKRKFQLSNGYLLEFDQLARLMNVLAEQPDAVKIARTALCESTGLTDRHVEGLVSIGAAMGLIEPGRQILSPVGRLVAAHDVFVEAKGSLEWCHYIASGTSKNLVWFEIFNTQLPSGTAMTTVELMDRLRQQFASDYSEKTLGKNLREEVRFVVDAYLSRHFKKLELLHKSGERIYTRRLTEMTPLVFAAIIYDYAEELQAKLIQTEDLLNKPGSPGLLFAMDDITLKGHLETLHAKGWLRYENTHNLHQVRLREGLTALAFLKAHFENTEPVVQTSEAVKRGPMDLFT